MDWDPGRHRRQDILVNVTRGRWRWAFGRWGGRRVAVCNLHGGQGALLGVEGNHLPHRALVSLLEMVVVILFRMVVVVLFRMVVDDKLATATWAVEHLAVNSSLPGFV